MDDAAAMCVVERPGDLDGVLEDRVRAEATLGNARAEQSTLDVLHDDEVVTRRLADLVNRVNIRMLRAAAWRASCSNAALAVRSRD